MLEKRKNLYTLSPTNIGDVAKQDTMPACKHFNENNHAFLQDSNDTIIEQLKDTNPGKWKMENVWKQISRKRNLLHAQAKGTLTLFKVNHENTKRICKICSKLIIKTPQQRH